MTSKLSRQRAMLLADVKSPLALTNNNKKINLLLIGFDIPKLLCSKLENESYRFVNA